MPALTPIGEGAVTVPKLKIGGPAELCGTRCPTSDLVPYPIHGKELNAISLSVSVTETGNVGIDFDAAAAEIKAIKEALGPAIADTLKGLLTKEE